MKTYNNLYAKSPKSGSGSRLSWINCANFEALGRSIGVLLAATVLVVTQVAPATAQTQPPAQTPATGTRTLGRLFTTPEQREALDRRRQLNIKEAEVVDDLGATTLNGRVVRSSGKSTTWVNGVPEDDAYRAREADRVAIDAGEARGRVPLKVGETLDRTQGSVSDGLNGGRVRVERPAPPPRRDQR